MLDTYFFIPADKPKYYEKIESLDVDYIVFDLEDSVIASNKLLAFDILINQSVASNQFVRVPVGDGVYSKDQLNQIVEKFNGRLVIPKVDSKASIDALKDAVGDVSLNLIVLLESPKGILNLNEILSSYHTNIRAVGFGSHDFCAVVGMKHSIELLLPYKQHIILLAKAFGVDYLDGVDTQLKDFSNLKKEAKLAFECGASGKFLIHPAQIDALKEVEFISKDELIRYEKVYALIKDKNLGDTQIINMDGVMYEKPHFPRIIKFIEKLNK
ncbi:MAG: HpcH/HpaI aldolase/citrate lyase family protein [Flavobacteriales bacterium]|jgi:citrate lyase subunit beta/citryl-CoA lyase